jgi:hypothetical protein
MPDISDFARALLHLLTLQGEGYAGTMQEDAHTTGFQPPPDDEDRRRDFLARHGGPAGVPPRCGETDGGLAGWSETEAADGWILRCDWSRLPGVEEIRYSEIRDSKDRER